MFICRINYTNLYYRYCKLLKKWYFQLKSMAGRYFRLQPHFGKMPERFFIMRKIRVDNPRPLKHRNRITRRKWVSTLQDEVLQMHEAEGDVFISSEILAALMVAPRSKMSWDIFVTKKEDGKLWFDMRQESPLRNFPSLFKIALNLDRRFDCDNSFPFEAIFLQN